VLDTVVLGNFARDASVNECLVVLAVGYSLVVVSVIGAAWAYGAPRVWPRWLLATIVLGSLGFAALWWWIDYSVEGRVLVEVSTTHALTVGDLVAVPALLTALLLVIAGARGARRRTREVDV
jgi:hypothetical protein